MADIVERLRAWVGAHGCKLPPEQNVRDNMLTQAAAEIERLRAALASCEAWIDRWTKHVGNCEGADKCTCGRTAVLFEGRAALSTEQEGDQG